MEMHKTLINYLILFSVRLLIFIKFHPRRSSLMDRRMLTSVGNKPYFLKVHTKLKIKVSFYID